MVDEDEISEGAQLASDVESLKQQLCMVELGKLINLICPPLKKFTEIDIFFIVELENAKKKQSEKRTSTKRRTK